MIKGIGNNKNSLVLQSQYNWKDLLHQAYSAQLYILRITDCSIGNSDIQIFQNYGWEGLKQLHLCRNKITATGLKRIVSQNCFNSLEVINLGGNLISDQGFQSLFNIKCIKRIILYRCEITSIGVRPFLNQQCPNLMFLDLTDNHIRAGGIKILVKATLTRLEDLRIQGNRIGNEGMAYLQKGSWPNLKKIFINLDYTLSGPRSTSLIYSNWNQLKELSGHFLEETPSINALFLMCGQWGSETAIQISDKLICQKEVRDLLYSKFRTITPIFG